MNTDAAGLEVVTSKAQLAMLATEHQLDFVPRTAVTLSALVRMLFVPRVPWARSAPAPSVSLSGPTAPAPTYARWRGGGLCCCCRCSPSNRML
jgi:hypothetical protein